MTRSSLHGSEVEHSHENEQMMSIKTDHLIHHTPEDVSEEKTLSASQNKELSDLN